MNQRFHAALRASGVTVFTQDNTLTYTWISKGELGRAPEEFVGLTDQDVLQPSSLEPIIRLKQGVIDSGEPARGEVRRE